MSRVATTWIVISLGGALIVPEKIATRYLEKFCALLLSLKQLRFVVVCGGGEPSRAYGVAARQLGQPTDDDIDWVGIHILRANAELVRVAFGKDAYATVPSHPKNVSRVRERIIVAGAEKPGSSSDLNAVLWAKQLEASRVINLTDIDYVYTADPIKTPSAQPMLRISWPEYRKIVGSKWTPRMNSPFDPMASREAARLGLEVAVLNGRNIANVKRAILGNKFIGTTIS